jgi:hypothetical protein
MDTYQEAPLAADRDIVCTVAAVAHLVRSVVADRDTVDIAYVAVVVGLIAVAVASWVDLAVVAWIVFFYFQTNIRHKHPLQRVLCVSISAFDNLWFGRSCIRLLSPLPGSLRQKRFVR